MVPTNSPIYHASGMRRLRPTIDDRPRPILLPAMLGPYRADYGTELFSLRPTVRLTCCDIVEPRSPVPELSGAPARVSKSLDPVPLPSPPSRRNLLVQIPRESPSGEAPRFPHDRRVTAGD